MWICWILPFFAISQIPKCSAISEDIFTIGVGIDKESNFLLWPLPPPLPPINDNIMDILKMLPLPTQIYKHKNNSNRTNDNDFSKAAEFLQRSLNESVNPCDDFYEFTCGKWLANNPIPKGERGKSQFNELSLKAEHQLKDLFVDPNPSSSKAINLVKSMYNACIAYDRKKPSALLESINEFCGWPILLGSEWDPECFNLPHLLAKIKRSLGLCGYYATCNIFLGSVVDQNKHNSSQQNIQFYQTHLGIIPIENYRNETKLEEYTQIIIDAVKVLASDAGIEICDETIRHEVNKIVDFEKELANITKHYNGYKEMDASLKARRFNELAKILSPALNLTEYFKTLLPIKETFHEYIASNPTVFFDNVFFENLSSLLRKTNKTTLANYVIWRYVMEWSIKHLDDRLAHKKAEIKEKRSTECVQLTSHYLKYVSGAMYVREHFGNDSKNAIMDLVKDLRNSFRKMLGQNNWMDAITRKRAIHKLDKVLPQIGFPDYFLNNSKLDAYYDELEFGENDSYSTMLEKISIFDIAKDFQKLLASTDRNEFDSAVYVVNAFFYPSRNIIRFPAAILQAPFFDKSFPKSMNYGGIGSVIGHEFTHGFDDHGSKYDEQGNENCWWLPDTKANFKKQKQCLIDEYSAIRMPEVNLTVNGSKTEIENQADLGGLKEAYLAYQAYLKKLGHEEKALPGFERFTNEQLFFINNGIIRCGHMTKETLKRLIKFNGHAPSKPRVNGVVSNMPEFATAFNCPEGSPMNPTKKCRVW